MNPVTKHDWPEDFKEENGNYINRCNDCKIFFTGYKRRVQCKACYIESLVSKVRQLKEAFNKIWQLGEMGYINTDGKPDVECGECGEKGVSRDTVEHKDHCIQGIISKAVSE